MQNKHKCSMLDHKDIEAISFCQECKIYICNKCEKLHSGLFKNHHEFKFDENNDISEIFTGICKEEKHTNELIYFCKTHNMLCCVECIPKVKSNQNGQHSECNVCLVEDIENEKKDKLKENIKSLEDLSINLNQSINELKKILDQIDKNKEDLKMEIQKSFTKLRNSINDREDQLLLEVDTKFNDIFINENIIKESEKLPNKIKLSIEKGKIIENKWKDNKLNSLINDCLNIEKNIKYIILFKKIEINL